jgi:hypothetical protein
VVGGDAELGVEPVEGPLGRQLGRGMAVVVDPVAVVPVVGEIGVVVGPGPDLGVVGGEVGGGVAGAPVLRVEFEGLGGQLLLG